MRLKMRFVLFGLLLLLGQEMRADSIMMSFPEHHVLMPLKVVIPANSLILFERVFPEALESNMGFGYEWAKLIAEDDTIPVNLIDSCHIDSRKQWLFKPGREMKRGKQYLFCVYFGMHDRPYGTTANCLILNNPIQHTADNKQPEMHGLPQLLETQDSAYIPFKKVFIRINATDENAMLLKVVYTDRVNGEKHKRYFQVQSTKSDSGSVVDIGIIDLNTAHTHALEITLIDLAGNQSAPILLSEDVRFKKGSRYVYGEESDPLVYLKMIGIIGICILFALGYFYYKFKRLTKNPN